MSRGLGGALTLSILAHSGAVATIGVVGAAWLTGPPRSRRRLPSTWTSSTRSSRPAIDTRPPTPPRCALGSERPGTSVGRRDTRTVRAAPPPNTPVAARPLRVTPSAPEATPPGTASAAPEVPRPPTVPVSPRSIDAGPESTASLAPAPQRPAPPPPQAASTPPAALSLADGPAADGNRAPRSDGRHRKERAPDEGARPGHAAPAPGLRRRSPGAAGVRDDRLTWSRDPGTRSAGGEQGRAGDQSRASAAGPARDGAGAGGEHLARLSPGEGQGGSAPDGGIPPEYESYVRALRQRVQDRLVYPWTAVRRGQQGVVELELRLGPDGRLVAVEVVAGASADTLRVAAVAAVRGSAPFPFPPGLAAAAARHPPPRRVPAALRGRNSRFFFDPPGSWAIVDGAMALDVTDGPVGRAAGRSRPGRAPDRAGVGRRVGGPEGSHPRGLRDQRRDAPRQVPPAPAPPGGGGDPRASPGRGRDRARRGRGTGIPQRVPLARVLPRRARADPRRGRPLRHRRRGARAARHGRVRQRQPHGAADARSRAAGDSRRLRGPAFRGDGLRDDPRVLLQQRGAPDARARRIGPRAVPGAPRPAGGAARGRLPGRLHPGDRGRASRPARGVARGRGPRERLPAGRGGRRSSPTSGGPSSASAFASTSTRTRRCSTPRGRSRPPSRRSERPGSSTTRTARSGSGSPPSAGRRTACW